MRRRRYRRLGAINFGSNRRVSATSGGRSPSGNWERSGQGSGMGWRLHGRADWQDSDEYRRQRHNSVRQMGVGGGEESRRAGRRR